MKALDALLRAAKNLTGLIAIEGMSASGKSSLARDLADRLNARVLHMDDFFLPLGQRTADWMQRPAGNMDLARFREEALLPALRGETIRYTPYLCGEDRFKDPVLLPPSPVTLVEGAYSMHPELLRPYALSAFLRVDPDTQRQRILKRNGPEGLRRFESLWIPLEERYFALYDIPGACDMILPG